LKEGDHREGLGTDERIILKLILKELDCIDLINLGPDEDVNETRGSTKRWTFVDEIIFSKVIVLQAA
jgi:hypothetical protein